MNNQILNHSSDNFISVTHEDFHFQRAKDMMKKYPQEMRAIMGNYWPSALIILAIVGTQFAVAGLLHEENIWITLAAAYFFGAFLNHALYVFIHEAAHNLVFKTEFKNRIMGMVCDLSLVVPGSMAFRKYHLIHHIRMGYYGVDMDIAHVNEAKFVGNSTFKKAIWYLFLGIAQATRPIRLKETALFDPWVFTNLIVQIIVSSLVVYFFSFTALIYLLASTIFGLGLHVVGARWVAEHYIFDDDQETYSYYGPLNPVIFNVGYHVEHHDLVKIAWPNLPKVKKIAPEFYDHLKFHPSYSKLLFRYLTDKKMTAFRRLVRG